MVYAVALSPASPFVHLSHVRVVSEWLNVLSHKYHCTIAEGLCFSDTKDLGEISTGSSPSGTPNTCRVEKLVATFNK